jgi:O-antigen/teichoic acid export membrane protein
MATPETTTAPEGTAPAAPDDALATLRAGGVVRSVVAFGLGFGVANLLHTLFHIVLARILKPAEYSLLASLLAVVLIFTVPIFALQATVAREIATQVLDHGERAGGLVLREIARWLTHWTLIVLVLGAVLSLPLALVFDVHRPLPAIATAFVLLATVPIPVAWGGLQGTGRFLGLGAAQAGFAVLKFGAGVTLGLLHTGSAGVMFGVGAASAVALAVAFIPLRPLWNSARDLRHRPMNVVGRIASIALVKLGLFAVLTNMDLLVARMAFPPTKAGAYAATSVAAKTLLLIPLTVTTVLLPHVATLRDRRQERDHLVAALLAVGALGVLTTAVMFAWPHALLEVAFGDRYLAAVPWLGPLAAAMALYAVAQVYVFHFLSLDRSRYVYVLGGIVLGQALGFAAFHGSPMALIRVQIGTALITLVVSEMFDHRARRVPAAAV